MSGNRISTEGRGPLLAYFAALGLGFILIAAVQLFKQLSQEGPIFLLSSEVATARVTTLDQELA